MKAAQPRWWKKFLRSELTSPESPASLEAGHQENRPGQLQKKHHHDLGIKAVLIHILGDALNNIGVVVAAAVIWKAPSEKRFYADPAMSLVIGFMLILTAWKLSK